MRSCIAQHVEPSATAEAMQPALAVGPFGILAMIQVMRPLPIGSPQLWSVDMRRSSVGELGFIARATKRAWNAQHKVDSRSVGDAGRGAFVDERAPLEAGEIEGAN